MKLPLLENHITYYNYKAMTERLKTKNDKIKKGQTPNLRSWNQ